jgi:ATP synthase I chain
MSSDFVGRVSRAMLVALAPVAAGGAFLAGWPGAIGSLAGGFISLGSFRWIAHAAARASMSSGRTGLALSALAVGARHLALFGVLAWVLWSGAAHPVALLAGLSVLPPIVIVLGLSEARLAG